jgi:hypothetical protein
MNSMVQALSSLNFFCSEAAEVTFSSVLHSFNNIMSARHEGNMRKFVQARDNFREEVGAEISAFYLQENQEDAEELLTQFLIRVSEQITEMEESLNMESTAMNLIERLFCIVVTSRENCSS